MECIEGQIRSVPMVGDVLIKFVEFNQRGDPEIDEDGCIVYRYGYATPEFAARHNYIVAS